VVAAFGPWTHASAFRQGAGTVFAESLAWLRGHLVGPAPPKGQVRIAVGGPTAEWRDLPSWPPAIPTSWYPYSDGALAREPPQSDSPVAIVRYDPADPTPAVGGSSLARRSGVRENSALEQREDVLVFTGPPLTEAIEVIGAVAAEILVDRRTGPASATLFVRLCDVDERGRSWNVCDGITRLTSRDPTRRPIAITVAMSSTAHRFEPGHRIRVQISGGAHPRFAAGREAFRVGIRPGSAIVLPAA
jgi:putative CocE/NonD family hydrolase